MKQIIKNKIYWIEKCNEALQKAIEETIDEDKQATLQKWFYANNAKIELLKELRNYENII